MGEHVTISNTRSITTAISDDSSVKVALGNDSRDRPTWVLAFVNKGEELRFALSDKAMDALLAAQWHLRATEPSQEAEWVLVQTAMTQQSNGGSNA